MEDNSAPNRKSKWAGIILLVLFISGAIYSIERLDNRIDQLLPRRVVIKTAQPATEIFEKNADSLVPYFFEAAIARMKAGGFDPDSLEVGLTASFDERYRDVFCPDSKLMAIFNHIEAGCRPLDSVRSNSPFILLEVLPTWSDNPIEEGYQLCAKARVAFDCDLLSFQGPIVLSPGDGNTIIATYLE